MKAKDTGGRDLSRMLLENRDVLFAYITALVRDVGEAEDIFQEVALVILKKEREGVEVRRFGPWSREIARNKVFEYWRAKRRTASVFLSQEALRAVEEGFARREAAPGGRAAELLQRLKECLERLPGHLRRLVRLRYTHGFSFERIGRELNRSAGAAQVALSRTRRRLLECMERLDVEGAGRNEA